MAKEDVYKKLAEHLTQLGMGYPIRDDLIEILQESFTPLEAAVALRIPTKLLPLESARANDIIGSNDLSTDEMLRTLDRLAEKGVIFSAKMKTGETGYALHQIGFGFPQTYFWKGEDTPHARKMAQLLAKYFNRRVTQEAFSSSQTKPNRYIPIGKSIETLTQAILPLHLMDKVIENAMLVAVAHCSCRIAFRLAGKGCDHPTEVCLKFNDMARYIIDHGFGREISKDEALRLVHQAEVAGLVHFVDNAQGDIQHNCNCCGCACWNVGSIRKRKTPRDILMATYFTRQTDESQCTLCGSCLEICPVNAINLDSGIVVVAEDWCIGCGLCCSVCPSQSANLALRSDKATERPEATFKELHQKIRSEKGLA